MHEPPLTPKLECNHCHTSPSDPQRCPYCKIVHYCNRNHQLADRDAHKPICKAIKLRIDLLEAQKRKIEEVYGPLSTIVADTGVDNAAFLRTCESTRAYLQDRYALMDALIMARTWTGVQTALNHAMEILRLDRDNIMCTANLIPIMYLRLDQDQECYDFIKLWFLYHHNGIFEWRDKNLHCRHFEAADTCEPLSELKLDSELQLSQLVSLTLMKLRMLIGLRGCHDAPLKVGDKYGFKDMDYTDWYSRTDLAEEQVDELFREVHTRNRHMWPAMRKGRNGVDSKPGKYGPRGTPEEAEITLHQCYQSWCETAGALLELDSREEAE